MALVSLELSDEMLTAARTRARQTGRSLSTFVIDAIRRELHRWSGGELPPLSTFGGDGLLPGVDLAASSELEDAMSGL